ncbi:Histone-lysine N-methyltransferase SETMAR, partial [Araneus ventricosus]
MKNTIFKGKNSSVTYRKLPSLLYIISSYIHTFVASVHELQNSHVIPFCRQIIKSGVHCIQTKDSKGVLLVDFMPKRTTINANRYCETLRKLRRAIQNRRRRMLSGGIVLLHDNAHPRTAAATQELLDHFGWETFDHPPYSLDLAPSDFHLFLKLKEFLGNKCFGSDEELENVVTTRLKEMAAEEYAMGILKLVDRYDKRLNVGAELVEWYRRLSTKQYLNWSLTSDSGIRRQDGSYVFRSVGAKLYGRDLTFNYIRDKWDVIFQRYGKSFFAISGLLKSVTSSLNTEFELSQ